MRDLCIYLTKLLDFDIVLVWCYNALCEDAITHKAVGRLLRYAGLIQTQ